MSRVPDLPCAVCGKMMWRGTGSLPEGKAKCLPCRRVSPPKRNRRLVAVERTSECNRCGITFTTCSTTKVYCTKKCSREAKRKPPVTSDCLGCGANLGDQRSKHCPSCSNRLRYGWNGGKEVTLWMAPPKAKRETQPIIHARPSKPRAFKSGYCVVCGAGFVTLFADRTCGGECQRANERERRQEHKQRRRARERQAYVAPVNRIAIYQRDNWTCQLCMEPIDNTETYPSPRSPSIDHVIPLAKGGTHEPSNVQAAHFICNSFKGDREGVAGGLDATSNCLVPGAVGVFLSAFLVGVPD